jgi:hypothetical protein
MFIFNVILSIENTVPDFIAGFKNRPDTDFKVLYCGKLATTMSKNQEENLKPALSVFEFGYL